MTLNRKGIGINNLTDVQAAYLAGLIDGEGCLAITKLAPSGMRRTPVYRAMLLVSMTCKPVIERISEMTGIGKIFYQDRKVENNCAIYQWTVYIPGDIIALLSAIRPYLIVKGEEADVLLEYLSLPSDHTPGRQPKPAFYIQRRDAYYQRMRDLKTRGKGLKEDRPKPEFQPLSDPQLALF